ncbi:hypothetical protein HFP15_04100 [Amycolatopsis sp. K13G38]|uniref:Transmembrane protein n=1 Tax=Amycolatopsis acididurans TaxID=2724524 RepID=A0ABX1IX36_9PSEU|nr:hypothetical protein [Amycolatopsis acididurans]NKQ52058.1 hypothetical protein [Amycolatopsis acididurans]
MNTTWLGRRLTWLGAWRNPLARSSDRIELAAVAVALLLALLAIPVALSVGSTARADALRAAAAQQATRTQTTAVLLVRAPDAAPSEVQPATPVTVNAVWRLPDGSDRTGVITADAGTPQGAHVPIWTDPAGNPVQPPLTASNATGLGVAAAVFAWVGFVAALALLCWLARFALDRARAAAWTREWAGLGRDLNRS